jgi:cytochrome bd-type quinol oxidase subunit 1
VGALASVVLVVDAVNHNSAAAAILHTTIAAMLAVVSVDAARDAWRYMRGDR